MNIHTVKLDIQNSAVIIKRKIIWHSNHQLQLNKTPGL